MIERDNGFSSLVVLLHLAIADLFDLEINIKQNNLDKIELSAR